VIPWILRDKRFDVVGLMRHYMQVGNWTLDETSMGKLDAMVS
jgi:hypothetical protein